MTTEALHAYHRENGSEARGFIYLGANTCSVTQVYREDGKVLREIDLGLRHIDTPTGAHSNCSSTLSEQINVKTTANSLNAGGSVISSVSTATGVGVVDSTSVNTAELSEGKKETTTVHIRSTAEYDIVDDIPVNMTLDAKEKLTVIVTVDPNAPTTPLGAITMQLADGSTFNATSGIAKLVTQVMSQHDTFNSGSLE